MVSDWETYGYRVEWTEAGSFAGQQHAVSCQVDTVADAMATVRKIAKPKPCTALPTWAPRVTELQRRVETRERVIGLNDWEKNR